MKLGQVAYIKGRRLEFTRSGGGYLVWWCSATQERVTTPATVKHDRRSPIVEVTATDTQRRLSVQCGLPLREVLKLT